MEHNRGITGQFVKNGKPNGFTTITPFIAVSHPAEAIHFYETVFRAQAKSITKFLLEGHEMVVHAELDFGQGYLQLGAASPDFGLVLPPREGRACYSLAIYVLDVDETLALAKQHGATVREETMNFVSGDRYCNIVDPYDIRWTIMTRIEDISQEESYARVEEWSKQQ